MRKSFRVSVLVLAMMFIIGCASSTKAYASSSLDDLSSGSATSSLEEELGSSSVEDNGNAVSNYFKGYTPITEDNMQKAQEIASPFVNFMGKVAGVIVIGVGAAVIVITGLDLAYIALPPIRSILNPSYDANPGQGAGGMAGGYGGMGGYGRGRYGMGGMMGGMGAMGGGQPAQPAEHGLRRRWVSDEAVFCVSAYAIPAIAQQGGAMSGMGVGMGGMGMGMGMGGMGMGMPGMGGMAQQQQEPMPTKLVIVEYFKKRVIFMVILAMAIVVLTSSVLTDCGINLAAFVMKLISLFSGKVAEVNISA